MSPMRDENLIRDPAIRQAVEARRATSSQPASDQPRLGPIGRLVFAMAIGTLVIVLISQIHLGG